MMNKTLSTLLRTTGIGLVSGLTAGITACNTIYQNAVAETQQVEASARASYLCSAGSAASFIGMLSVPAGAIFGFCLGGIFLLVKTRSRRLP